MRARRLDRLFRAAGRNTLQWMDLPAGGGFLTILFLTTLSGKCQENFSYAGQQTEL
jgi:hypothetical protein